MSLDIRAPLDPIFAALGVEATVTVPGGDPVETTVIWLSPMTEEIPMGLDVHKVESVKVMELRKDQVPTAPNDTRIEAPEVAGGEIKTWRVDATVQEDRECRRVVVMEVADES